MTVVRYLVAFTVSGLLVLCQSSLSVIPTLLVHIQFHFLVIYEDSCPSRRHVYVVEPEIELVFLLNGGG